MRKLWKRVFVILATGGGLLAMTVPSAEAGINLANHSEPTVTNR